jgi:predicted methyltransferase
MFDAVSFRRIASSALVLLVAAGAAVVADAGTDSAIDRAVANEGRSDADRTRDATSKPVQVLEFFGLKPGMVVVDLFAGGGYYTELVAHVVGSTGKVYLHNNKAYMGFIGEELEARLADGRLANVVSLMAEADDLGLPEGKADLILMVMSYHDLYFVDDGWPEIDRKRFWNQVLSALKPGGTLAVVDHVAMSGTGSTAAQDLHRIDKNFAMSDIEAAGFVFQAESAVLRNHDDDHSLLVFDPKIRRKTDRFVYRFKKK